MRTAILGGTGSIGMATAARIAKRGVGVSILSRRRPADVLPLGVVWHSVDITDPISLRRTLAKEGIDRVAHLAALLQFACETDPGQAVRVNVNGTLNVLEACRDLGISRLVFGSSIAVYGERSDLMRESDLQPGNLGLYGLTKRLGEMLGQRFRSSCGLEFVALRYSGVFGPGVATSAGMAQVRQRILDCACGKDLVIEGASGNERVHLTYLDDAAEATCIALLSTCPANSIYNVAGPTENYISLQGLHDLVREIVPGAGRALWSGQARSAGPVDVTQIGRDLGWRPIVSLKDGVRDVLLSKRQLSNAAA